MKRYQVMFCDRLSGLDDGRDFDRKADAMNDARRNRHESAAIYDRQAKAITVVYGNPYNWAFCPGLMVKTLRGAVVA